MKMTKEDYERIVSDINEYVEHFEIDLNRAWNDYKKAKLTAERFRWDILIFCKFDICSLYHYLNDDHIDTALRKYFKNITV